MGMYGSGKVGNHTRRLITNNWRNASTLAGGPIYALDGKTRCDQQGRRMHGCTEAERWLAHMHAPADETCTHDWWSV